MNKKTSSENLASQAAKILQSNNASDIQKSLAASVLSQVADNKQTGKEMETKASNVLKSNKYSDLTKSFAGSVLSQSDKNR